MIEHAGADDEKVLVAIAAYGLPGSVTELPLGPYHDDEWTRLVGMSRARGLLGMLSAAGHAGRMALSAAQIEELTSLVKEREELVALVEAEAVRVSELLSKRGVDHRLLGGVPLRFHYRTPELRSHATDAVLLVESDAADAGRPRGNTWLDDLAVEPSGRQPVVRVHKTVQLEGHSLRLADLLGPRVTLELPGYEVPTATADEHLVLACMGLDAQAPRPVTQRDIAELALSPGVTAEGVQVVADVWNVTSPVMRALADVWRRFELADKTELSVWAARGETRPQREYGPGRGRPGQILRRRARGAFDRFVRRRETPTATRRISS